MSAQQTNPLPANIRIVDHNGLPMIQFQRQWQQQQTINSTIPDLSTATKVSKVIDLLGKVQGDILYRGPAFWAALPPAAINSLFTSGGPGANPAYQSISAVLDTLGLTQGSILYRGPAGWTVLAPSVINGFVLTYNTATVAPEWDAPPGSTSPASIVDDGTTVSIALSDGAGQLVLDGSGNPVLMPEVFPPSAIPLPTASTIGGVESIAPVAHNFLTGISTAGAPSQAQPAATDLSDFSMGAWTPIDTSGAGLALAVSSATYIKIGKLLICTFAVSYPVTSSPLNAQIGGIPFTVASGVATSAVTTAGINFILLANAGTTTVAIFNAGTVTSLTNAQLSGQLIITGLVTITN